MKVFVTFKELNPDYDQEYANEYQDGNESENNWKVNWETKLKTNEDVSEIRVLDNVHYKLWGTINEKTDFSYDIPNMTILECVKNDSQVIQFAVSKTLLKRTHKVYNNKCKTLRFYFYFVPNSEPYTIKPKPGVYIFKENFPKELLIKHDEDLNRKVF